jgi:hypothetical protein
VIFLGSALHEDACPQTDRAAKNPNKVSVLFTRSLLND